MKIIGISGSLRIDSWNRKALTEALVFAKIYSAEIEEFDLKKNPLPLYDADLIPLPESVHFFAQKIKTADILFIASPEYNHSVSGVLKNALDWLSVADGNVLSGKYAVIFGVSTGVFGTMRAQAHLRQILESLNVFLIPQPEVFLSIFHFDEGGHLKQEFAEKLKKLIEKTLIQL